MQTLFLHTTKTSGNAGERREQQERARTDIRQPIVATREEEFDKNCAPLPLPRNTSDFFYKDTGFRQARERDKKQFCDCYDTNAVKRRRKFRIADSRVPL